MCYCHYETACRLGHVNAEVSHKVWYRAENMDSNREHGDLFAGTKLASKTYRLSSLLVNKEVTFMHCAPDTTSRSRKSALRATTEI